MNDIEYQLEAARQRGIETAVEHNRKLHKRLKDRIAELEDECKCLSDLVTQQEEGLAMYEAKLDAVKALPDKWREGIKNWHKDSGISSVAHLCADELEAAIGEQE